MTNRKFLVTGKKRALLGLMILVTVVALMLEVIGTDEKVAAVIASGVAVLDVFVLYWAYKSVRA